jgi:hypothetical protein
VCDSSCNLLSNRSLFGGLQPIVGSYPKVAMDNGGNAVVVFQHNADGAGADPSEPHVVIAGLRLDSFGDIVGAIDVGTGQDNEFSDVAMSPSGGWYVVAH